MIPGRGKPAKDGRKEGQWRDSVWWWWGSEGRRGGGSPTGSQERRPRLSLGIGLPAVDPGPRPLCSLPCPQTLAAVLTALPRSSPAELTISALSLALLVPVKELNVRFRDRLPTPIPGEIAMVRMAPGCQPRAPRRPCLPCRKWPLPPPRGARRGHTREVLLTRVLCQAPCQSALTLGNLPPTGSPFSHKT